MGWLYVALAWTAIYMAHRWGYRVGAKDGKAEGYYMAMKAMYAEEMGPTGDIEVTYADGTPETWHVGADGKITGEEVDWDEEAEKALLAENEMGFGDLDEEDGE